VSNTMYMLACCAGLLSCTACSELTRAVIKVLLDPHAMVVPMPPTKQADTQFNTHL
jgi:hypothetical protein